MAINEFKAFAIGSTANVVAQADYESLPALSTGFQSGKASSAQVNKAIRQATVMASVLAQFISDSSGTDVVDNGDLDKIVKSLISGLKNNNAKSFLLAENDLSEITNTERARGNLGLKAGAIMYSSPASFDGLAGSTNEVANTAQLVGLRERITPVSKGGTGASSSDVARGNLSAAYINGSPDHDFQCRNNGMGSYAVNNDRLNFVLGAYADIAGSPYQDFSVAGGGKANSAVSYSQLLNILSLYTQSSSLSAEDNVNGHAIRLPNATICRANISLNANGSTNWTFPATFPSSPAVFTTAFNSSNKIWLNGISSTGCSFYNDGEACNINALGVY